MMSIPPKVRSPFVWSLTKRQVCSLTLIITLLCSSCLIAGYSYAASIGAQKYPTSYMEGGPTGAYDYMIYTFQNDTNTYYAAKNSFGDNIDSWTSTNFVTTTNLALNTTGQNGGGKVVISKNVDATYSTAIKIHYSNVHLIAEAGNKLYHTGIDYCVNIAPVIAGASVDGIDNYLSNVLVEGLNITASGEPEEDGITATFLKDSIIQNNFVANTTEEGIILYDCVNVKVRNNNLLNCGTLSLPLNPAIEIKNTELSLPAYGNKIYENTLIGSKRCGIFIHGATDTEVVNNKIYDTALGVDTTDSSASAIYITSGPSDSTDGAIVKGNFINNSRYFGIIGQAYLGLSLLNLEVTDNRISYCFVGIAMKSNSFNQFSIIESNTVKFTTSTGLLVQNVSGLVIKNNDVIDCPLGTAAGSGIFLYNGCYDNKVSGNYVFHSVTGGSTTWEAIRAGTNCARNQITDNRVDRGEALSGTAGIYLDTNADDNFVSGNFVNGTHYGLRVVFNTSDNNVLQNNKLINTNALALANTGTGTIIKYNSGFITENTFSGANTTATTAVLNHGLAAAATGVWASFNDTAITGYTWTSSATQVTITPTGTLPSSWTCYVNAVYKP